MSPRVLWKLLASALLLGYAIFCLLPLTTTPFERFAPTQVSQDRAGFDAILRAAEQRVTNYREKKEPAAPTIYQAIRDIVNDPAAPVDLHARFFPHLDLVKQNDLSKRNLIVLRHILKLSQGKLKLGLDLQGGVAFTLKVPEQAFENKNTADRAALMNEAAKVMSDRINQYGVAEPLIRTVGSNILEIQLPGEDMANNPDAIEALKKPAKLEFSYVHRFEHPKPGEPESFTKLIRENPNDVASPVYEYQVMIPRSLDPKTGAVVEGAPVYVVKKPFATGDIIKNSYTDSQDGLNWHVSIRFSDKGDKVFYAATKKLADDNIRTNTSGNFGIILDGKLISHHGIRENKPISGGAQIDMGDKARCDELVGVLNNPLAFPLELQDTQTVGPSLATEAQSKSVVAAAVGVAVVVLFMVCCYMASGVVAVLALCVNLTVTLGLMAMLGVTITLPGVAALVLTVGMAVDSNILIFERIREEMATGKSLRIALETAYSRVLAPILDANITAMLTALILFYMGTGSVKGFGLTLAVGIVTTVITAVITTRGLQELAMQLGLLKNIFGLKFLNAEPRIRFLDYARKAFTASWIVILIGIVAMAVRGRECVGKDFKGGEAVTVLASQTVKLDPGEIEEIAKGIGIKDVTAAYLSKLGAGTSSLRVECPLSKDGGEFANANRIVAELVAKRPTAFPADKTVAELITGRESIGATVSEGLQYNAVISVLLALVGIVIYVGLRFEIGFAMGALVATVHDVLMVIGLYVLYGAFLGGAQFTASMVAAVLMIIGYSINDTVVVFDRIREEMAANPALTLKEVIHLALNRMLARTLMTSVTVLGTALALFLFGAGDVKEYGLMFVFGVISGTCSSIFIASPVFYWWHKGDRASVEKSDAGEKREWELNGPGGAAKLAAVAPVDDNA